MPEDASGNRPVDGSGAGGAPPRRTPTRLRDPLVVFLLLAAGVFALDRWVESGDEKRRAIEVTADEVEGLRVRWTAQWGRPPTGPELAGLIEEAIDEEILYREAQRLGLDVEDAIVRRRLAQKMTFVLEDAGGAAPSGEEVAEYHARHAERYRRPPRTTFDHVFLSADRRSDPAGDAAALLRRLGSTVGGGLADGGWKQLGDPFMLARTYRDRTDTEIAGLFGTGFAGAVAALPTGGWRGPIESTYGMHLVRVRGRTASRAPRLDAVRDRVVADLREERRRERGRAAYLALRDDYEVRLPAPVVAASARD